MKTTRLLSLLAIMALTVSPSLAGDAKSIFTGKDLSGWKAPEGNDAKGWYTAADGELRIQSGPEKKGSILWTENSYRNFELTFDFKFGEGTVDTGVHIKNDKEQIQIGISGSLKRDMTGSPYIAGKGYPVEAEGVKELLKLDDWNSMKIRVTGKLYEVWLNGKQVLSYESESAIDEGPLGLQLHGGKDMGATFRDLRITELN
ncbi:MAG: DUF1080 domain-containing protein [Verrucomicrobiae bacterium]|nr:DUF1080 domain-containing protein [Verrucomicrobiae bacterium]